jgi:hypothetical protein
VAALDFGTRELRRTNCTSRSLDLVRLATEKNLCALGFGILKGKKIREIDFSDNCSQMISIEFNNQINWFK